VYLHDAIRTVLAEASTPMDSSDLAQLVNRRRLYVRKDKEPVPARQVSARAKRYPQSFHLNRSASRMVIGLNEWTKKGPS
jgi:hypothetical protein